jgi:hypothetical protein
VENSTQDISREVASVHKDVTAILNLLLKATTLQHDEHLPKQATASDGDRQPNPHYAAPLHVKNDSSGHIHQQSAPLSEKTTFSSTCPVFDPQVPSVAVKEPKPPFKDYILPASRVTATASIVLLADSNRCDSKAADSNHGDSKAAAVLISECYEATEGGNMGSSSQNNDSCPAGIGKPAATTGQNSAMEGQEWDQLARPAFIGAPLVPNLDQKKNAAVQDVGHDSGAQVVLNTVLAGPSLLQTPLHQDSSSGCASCNDIRSGDMLIGGWRSKRVLINRGCGNDGVCSPPSSESMLCGKEYLPGMRRNVLELFWPPSRDGSVVPPDTEVVRESWSPQSTGSRSCKGRWVGGVRRRGSSCDHLSVEPELEPTSQTSE